MSIEMDIRPAVLASQGPGGIVCRVPRAGARDTTGIWRSLVARFVRDEEVAGSNPVIPTKNVPSEGNFGRHFLMNRVGALGIIVMVGKTKVFSLPGRVPVSSIFLDESGTRNSSGGFFVVGFVKVRDLQTLDREIRHLRQTYGFHQEIHFSEIKNNKVRFYFELVELLASSDVRVGGSVYDSSSSFSSEKDTWQQQATMASRLIRGNINRGELVNVFVDLVQTPRGESVAQSVKNDVNRSLGSRCVLEAYDLNSEASDFIQLADVVASSIAYERRHGLIDPTRRNTPKARVAARLRRALELDSFDDIQQGKVNIVTMHN